MNKTALKLFIGTSLTMLLGCDQAPSQRRAYNGSDSNVQQTGTAYNYGSNGTTLNTGTGTGTGTTTNLTTIPEGAQHCQWSLDGSTGYRSSSTHLGAYNICQSQSDDNIIYIQLQTPVTDKRVCMFPLHFQSGNSTYIGEAKCLTISDRKIYQVTTVTNRSGFTSLAVNGVMMMKDESHFYAYPYNGNWASTQAYLVCNQYLQAGYPDFCTAFKQVNAYVSHSF